MTCSNVWHGNNGREPIDMTFTFSELAQRFGLILRGDPSRTIEGVATLANAGPNHLGFLANPRYRRELANTAAGALVLRAEDIEHWPGDALIARDPYSAFARIAAPLPHQP